ENGMEMMKVGLRPPIVHAATGLCRNRLRRMYQEIHGKPAVQGRVSKYAYNRLKTKSQVMEATGYYQVYHRLGGEQIFRGVDPVLFITAYQSYKGCSRCGIDGTTAWLIARDLRENYLTPRRCEACGREYLYTPRSDLMNSCPLCAG
ncbi:MAG: FlhC family transcriptional regulator, partial [Syntrophales bacterium]